MNRRIAFQTLGCRLNQYETDSIASSFRRAGYEIVPFDDPADCYVMNTCTVTDRSDRKSRNLINRATRARGVAVTVDPGFGVAEVGGRESVSERATSEHRPGVPGNGAEPPVVVVTGCFAESNRAYAEEREGVTYVVDNERKHTIFDLVDGHFRGEVVDPNTLTADRFGFGDALEGFHTRATVKIQDGCDNFCTFCIIPFVRGRAASRPHRDILLHTAEVIEAGAKEIVLTGVNMGRYDDDGVPFTRLVERILDLPGDFRVRLSSIEPDIRGNGLETLVGHEKLCPHLHLCLQSGSDRILLAMRRQYNVAGYLEMVDAIRARDESFNFTTDIIVGFPGETDQEFSQTLRVAERVGFSHIHTFPYSVRTGTKAERLSGHVDSKTKAARSARVRELSDRMKRAYRSRFVRTVERLLVEKTEEALTGYGSHYVPISAAFPITADASDRDARDGWRNTFVNVRLDALEDGDDPVLHGSVIPEPPGFAGMTPG